MPKTVPALTLPDRQTRMINAAEGFRLEVLSGCLWLTRPSDSVDRFLAAGDSLELHEAQVLIQSDRRPGQPERIAASYRLEPLLFSLSAAVPVTMARAKPAIPSSDKSVATMSRRAPSAC
jgi:hypothetical protein